MKPGGAKRKGYRLERELVADLLAAGLDARRQPGSGIYDDFPHDLELKIQGQRYIGECKARKESFKTLDGWLGKADFLIVKNDRKDPRVYMTWRSFRELAQLADQNTGSTSPSDG